MPMRWLKPQRKAALHSIYAFCRAVDDIADSAHPVAEKKHQLEQWAQTIDAIYTGASLRNHTMAKLVDQWHLPDIIRWYDLQRSDFDAILKGMDLDVEGHMLRPSLALLETYCDHVAGAVGRLAVRIFGCKNTHSDAFAYAMGQMLQRINIYRDVREDAAIGRIYLPMEYLTQTQCGKLSCEDIVQYPTQLEPSKALLYQDIIAWRQRAENAITPQDRWRLLPAYGMATSYLYQLRLLRKGRKPSKPPMHILWLSSVYSAMTSKLASV